MLAFIGLGGTELTLILITLGVFITLPLFALIDILRSQFQEPNNKLIWVIVVLALNVIGAVLYYAIGRKQRMA